jgi:hypothetical protein
VAEEALERRDLPAEGGGPVALRVAEPAEVGSEVAGLDLYKGTVAELGQQRGEVEGRAADRVGGAAGGSEVVAVGGDGLAERAGGLGRRGWRSRRRRRRDWEESELRHSRLLVRHEPLPPHLTPYT